MEKISSITPQIIEDHRARLHAVCDNWFSDPDTWVGLFENHDLWHPQVGRRCAFPFRLSDGSFDNSDIGKTRAPDGLKIGLGWRYILQGKAKTAAEVLAFLEHEENKV